MISNVVKYTPIGVLQHVIRAFQIYNEDMGPDGLVSPRVEEWLKNFDGFFAAPGVGCDAVVQRVVNRPHRLSGMSFPQMTEVRCREQPCAWFQYQLHGFPARIGVRVCSNHIDIAGKENCWERSIIDKDLFSIWEIMTD
jgi:hypothetical protein